jgi:hypothetical protein
VEGRKMTNIDRSEAERLLRKYDVKTLAPLAVSCGMVRVLKEREQQIEQERQRRQLTFDWEKIGYLKL